MNPLSILAASQLLKKAGIYSSVLEKLAPEEEAAATREAEQMARGLQAGFRPVRLDPSKMSDKARYLSPKGYDDWELVPPKEDLRGLNTNTTLAQKYGPTINMTDRGGWKDYVKGENAERQTAGTPIIKGTQKVVNTTPPGQILNNLAMGQGRGRWLLPIGLSGAAGAADYASGDSPAGAGGTALSAFVATQPWLRHTMSSARKGELESVSQSSVNRLGQERGGKYLPGVIENKGSVGHGLLGGAASVGAGSAMFAGQHVLWPVGKGLVDSTNNLVDATTSLDEGKKMFNQGIVQPMRSVQHSADSMRQFTDALMGVHREMVPPPKGAPPDTEPTEKVTPTWWGNNMKYVGGGLAATGGVYALAKLIQAMRSQGGQKKKSPIPAGAPGVRRPGAPRFTLKHPGQYDINLENSVLSEHNNEEAAKAASATLSSLL